MSRKKWAFAWVFVGMMSQGSFQQTGRSLHNRPGWPNDAVRRLKKTASLKVGENSKCYDRMGRDKIPQTKRFFLVWSMLARDSKDRFWIWKHLETMRYKDIVISNSGWSMVLKHVEKSRLHSAKNRATCLQKKLWALSFLDPILKFLGDDLAKAHNQAFSWRTFLLYVNVTVSLRYQIFHTRLSQCRHSCFALMRRCTPLLRPEVWRSCRRPGDDKADPALTTLPRFKRHTFAPKCTKVHPHTIKYLEDQQQIMSYLQTFEKDNLGGVPGQLLNHYSNKIVLAHSLNTKIP